MRYLREIYFGILMTAKNNITYVFFSIFLILVLERDKDMFSQETRFLHLSCHSLLLIDLEFENQYTPVGGVTNVFSGNTMRTNVIPCVPLTFYTLERNRREWSNDEANRRHGFNSADNEALIIVGQSAHRQLYKPLLHDSLLKFRISLERKFEVR